MKANELRVGDKVTAWVNATHFKSNIGQAGEIVDKLANNNYKVKLETGNIIVNIRFLTIDLK